MTSLAEFIRCIPIMLHEVKGPTGFCDLKSVSEINHTTFQSACRARGLLEDDDHWERALVEAAISESAHRMRELFAVMLVFCQIADPLALWEKFKDNFSEDLKRQVENEFRDIRHIDVEHYNTIVYNKTLVLLEQLLSSISNHSLDQFGLPRPTHMEDVGNINREYLRELSYDVHELTSAVHEKVPLLNDDQRRVYRTVISSIDESSGQLFFLDAPGGTGKTFLIP